MVIALLALLGIFGGERATPLRVAYGESFPFSYTREGRAAGFVIAVLDAAAAREGATLQWVKGGSTAENNAALSAGRLDLIPLGATSPERERQFYVAPPWWTEESILVLRAAADRSAPLSHSIALPDRLLSGARQHYPAARLVPTVSAPQALEQLCLGQTEAALVGSTYIRQLIGARPPACESVALRIADSPAAVGFSLISPRRVQVLTRRLHEHIVEMTADGTLARIAAEHPPVSTPQAARLTELQRARLERRQLLFLLGTAALVLTAGTYVLGRQVRAQRVLEATVEQQRRAEQELRDSELLLQQRTQELVRSNEDLQAFAYSVSHDLQEPVRNQCLFSQLIQRQYGHELSPGASHQLQVIQTSAQRMQEMVQSLLVYSRAAQSDRPKTKVDCNLMVARVQNDLHLLLQEAGARLEAGPLPEVWAWEERLQQVFQNLVENAAKYRRDGVAPVIRITAQQTGDEWQFTVTDNGIGFRQDQLERMFGLFKRLHTQDKYGGSGIGLALCRRVLERHGGRIWAEGRPGEGSSFHFTLPFAAAAEPAVQQPASVPA